MRLPSTCRPVRGLVVVWAGIVAVGVIVIVRLWTTADAAVGDVALIEIDTRRVLSSDPPTLGVYSRYGWRHAGPALFYVLAVPYRVLGGGIDALNSAAVLFNVVVMSAVVLLARRRSHTVAAAMGVALVLLVSHGGVDGIGSAWNVPVTQVPIVLVLVACWAAWCGDAVAVPIGLAAYLFVLQTHIGAGVVVTPVVLATAVAVVARRPLRSGLARSRPSWQWSVLAVVALGGPVALDALRNPPGNIVDIIRWSARHDEPSIGWAASARLLGRTSSLSFPGDPNPPRFLLDAGTSELGIVPGAMLVLLIAALILAVRAGWRDEVALCVVCVGVWGSGLVAARSIVAPPAWWLLDWLQPLGWFTIAVVAIVGWRAVQTLWSDRRRRDRSGWVVVSAAIAAGVAQTAVATASFDGGRIERQVPVEELADASESLAAETGVVLEFAAADFGAEVVLAGVIDELDARSVDVCVVDALAYKFPSMDCAGGVRLLVTVRAEPVSLPAPDGTVVVAISDPLDAQTRARADDVRRDLEEALIRIGRGDLVGVLDTPLVGEVLAPLPAADLSFDATVDEIELLAAIRSRPGTRYGLYATRPPTDAKLSG